MTDSEVGNLEENRRKNGRSYSSIPKDLPRVDISDEKVTSVLQYLESTIIRSNILATCNQDDVSVISDLLNDRINDLTILSAICQGLLTNNRSLRDKVDELQKYIKLQNERDAEVTEYLKINTIRDEIKLLKKPIPSYQVKNFQEKRSISLTSPLKEEENNLKERCDDLDKQNTELITKILNLTNSRQLADEQEQNVVDNIIQELKQKREETSTLTKRITEQISDYLEHQGDISELLISNSDILNKYETLAQSKNSLKQKVKQLTDACRSKDAEIEFLVKNNKELTDNLVHFFSKQNTESNESKEKLLSAIMKDQLSDPYQQHPTGICDKMLLLESIDNESQISKISDSTHTSSEYESNPKLLTRKYIDQNGNEKVQIIKTMEGSTMMKKWKQLDDENQGEGLNSIKQISKLENKMTTPSRKAASNSLLSKSPLTPRNNYRGAGLGDLLKPTLPTPKIQDNSPYEKHKKFTSIKTRGFGNYTETDPFNNIQMSDANLLKQSYVSKLGGNVGKTLTQYGITPLSNDGQTSVTPNSAANNAPLVGKSEDKQTQEILQTPSKSSSGSVLGMISRMFT